MTKFSFNQAVPFKATHVGEVIKDELSARNMKQSDLSKLTGIQKPILNDVIKGKRSLTPEMALLIGKVFGISADYLMNIQTQYDLDKAKQSERVILQTKMMDIWNVLKDQISVRFFKKVNIINGNIVEDVKHIFNVFGVDNLDDFLWLRAKEEVGLSYYRKSDKVKTNSIDIFSWKYYCYYLSRKDESTLCAFNKELDLAALIKSLNNILKENVDTVNRTRRVLNGYGIRFLVINKAGQVPVDGMSFWIGKTPTIVLTERIASIDNFAFTLFHEIGHVFFHLTENGEAMINIDGEKNNKEIEANKFALNAILPAAEWKRFMVRTRDIVPYKIAPYIEIEADKYDVNPQILFGRYKHDIGIYKIRNPFETRIL